MITQLDKGTMLYHGSYCEVRTPDLSKCRRYKDFGQGFYLTTDLDQAKRFAEISYRKAAESGALPLHSTHKFVSCFEYAPAPVLDIKIFETADVEWLHCVVAHRRKRLFTEVTEEMRHKDIIGGKIANDNTNTTITAYILGTYGKPGTLQADNICIGFLIPDRLKDQYCFRTQRSLDCLVFRRCIQL